MELAPRGFDEGPPIRYVDKPLQRNDLERKQRLAESMADDCLFDRIWIFTVVDLSLTLHRR